MKWSDAVVILGLLAVIAFLGNGVISCASQAKAPTATKLVTVDINEGNLIERGYVSVGQSTNVTIEYLGGGWGKGWYAFEYNTGEFGFYQELDSYLDKSYKYIITKKYIDND